MRQELLYRGMLDLGDGADPRHLEVWSTDGAAVAFEGGRIAGRATGVTVELTDDGRIRVAGEGPDGDPVEWTGAGPAVVGGEWPGARVRWADGRIWNAASVRWTQYGVEVRQAGQATAKLAGARTVVQGAQRGIRHAGVLHQVESTSRGCGCGKG